MALSSPPLSSHFVNAISESPERNKKDGQRKREVKDNRYSTHKNEDPIMPRLYAARIILH